MIKLGLTRLGIGVGGLALSLTAGVGVCVRRSQPGFGRQLDLHLFAVRRGAERSKSNVRLDIKLIAAVAGRFADVPR